MKITHMLIGLMACAPAAYANTPATAPTEDDVILHAWSWALDTIAANMKDIAEALTRMDNFLTNLRRSQGRG